MKVVAFLASLVFCGFVFAQTNTSQLPTGIQTSPNLIGICTVPTTSGVCAANWQGTTATTSDGGGYSGGNQPGYNATTNTIMFGYTQSTAAYTYAFNTALQNSGMSITGYNYKWDYINEGMTSGNLTGKVNFAGIDGTSLHSKSWILGPTTGGWTTTSGTETFTNALAALNIANFSLSFSGKDSRYWAGYYGPQVKNPSLTLNYTFNQCVTNPLSSPDCPGYAAAYLTQQCTANPLYNTECPGYAVAYATQQCTINSLSDPTCPGYAAAFLTQQCNLDPLYSTTCVGYETAYFNQQCTNNALYSTKCTGYAQAYFDQQCSLNALYDQKCPNYSTAYATKMLLEQQGMATTVAIAGSIKAADPATTTTVSPTGNTTVDKALPPPATTANSAAAPAAPVQLAPQQSTAQAVAQAPKEQAPPPPPPPAAGPGMEPPAKGPDGKEAPKTARQEMQERRQAAARQAAPEKMVAATSMEQQKQVQEVVLQAMAFTPGFSAYYTMMPDGVGYKSVSVYNNQVNVDNRRASRSLLGPSDKLHEELINSQYKGK